MYFLDHQAKHKLLEEDFYINLIHSSILVENDVLEFLFFFLRRN